MSQHDSHEKLTQKNEVKSGSNRSFGLVFASVFALIGLWPLLDGEPIQVWGILSSLTLVVISFMFPKILGPFNRWWFLLGHLLHKIVSPLIMGLIFFSTVTPIGIIMRVLGKRPLPMEFDAEVKSYWIERKPPGPEPESMTRQF